jgi:predicted short-subunit dehydrogenase-like oxidoreductase (DUF2520 family)
MIKVSIAGSGRLAKHLMKAIKGSNLELVQIWARDKQAAEKLSTQFQVPVAATLQAASDQTDLLILAVSDSAVEELANTLQTNAIVVHCSGILSSNILQMHPNYGVLWPIQSFSENRDLDFKTIPIVVDANNEENKRILEITADTIGKRTVFADESQRQKLHVAAVFVNNFSNHLYVLMEDFLKKNNLSFNHLKPLMLETVLKLDTLSANQAQTGPAKRGDELSLNIHREILASEQHLLEIYNLISKSIQSNQHI